ncbi:MAG: Jag N-terminal domain-containing protein [Eubacteriales bacterium]|nr:Jag N-terminal domain-containing protein [Eubacteriales bacterium]MDD3350253.1 Jag N-terminal domain-containing protein [Eubacteriales bacterium]
MDYSEKWGRDVEEAVNLALVDLRLEREQVEVVVLEEPSKGFFGIGSKLAKVRVQKCSGDAKKASQAPTFTPAPAPTFTPAPTPAPVKEQAPAIKEAPVKKEYKEEKREVPAQPKAEAKSEPRPREEHSAASSTNIRIRPENLQEVTDEPALAFLKEVTEKMGLELSVKAMANEECLFFDISGKDSGSIIGKRGQTLDSIQYLTSLVVNKDSNKYTRVIVDAENYRQKREKTLEQLANRLADKVKRTGKSVRLEPMNPYERKVIHATLQKNPAVTTRSEGEEPYRRVIIEQK